MQGGELPEFNWHGTDLHRPECVLCTSDGSLFVSDWGGGVTHINRHGGQRRILARKPPVPILPNGIAIQRDGSFLLANLGDDGGVWKLGQDGRVEPFLLEVAGRKLPPCNYVMVDFLDRVWVTVSTKQVPRSRGYRRDIADGFIVCVDGAGSRVVADGLGYTNEVQIDPAHEWLYVNETFSRRLTRHKLAASGDLGEVQVVAEFGDGIFPDGLMFDESGTAWIVSIVSNSVIRVAANGEQQLVFSDSDARHVEWVEKAFVRGEMDRPHLDNVQSSRLRNVSSIAFGGPDRRIAYLGCLLGSRVASFRAAAAGVKPVHWDWNQEWRE